MWNYVKNKYQKIFENNPHIFKCNVTFTNRDFDLANESLNKVRRLRKHRVVAEKKAFKWVLNVNMGFPGSSSGKESFCNAVDTGSIPG